MAEMKEGQGLILNLTEKSEAELLKLKLIAVLVMLLLAKQNLMKWMIKKN